MPSHRIRGRQDTPRFGIRMGQPRLVLSVSHANRARYAGSRAVRPFLHSRPPALRGNHRRCRRSPRCRHSLACRAVPSRWPNAATMRENSANSSRIGRGKAKPRHRSRGCRGRHRLLLNSSTSCVLPTPCTPSTRIIPPETSPVPRMYWRCLVIAPSSSPRLAKCKWRSRLVPKQEAPLSLIAVLQGPRKFCAPPITAGPTSGADQRTPIERRNLDRHGRPPVPNRPLPAP